MRLLSNSWVRDAAEVEAEGDGEANGGKVEAEGDREDNGGKFAGP